MKKCDEEAIRRWLVTAILVGSVLAMVTVVASAATIYVPDAYPTIQQAVNNAIDGDIIIVRDGTYTENVDVNKRLTIRSEKGSANCIVNAADSNDHVFNVTANYVNITGFTVKYANGWGKAGICMNGVNHCNIKNNNISYNGYGIDMDYSNNNNISCNTIYNNNYDGISMDHSSNNNVYINNIYDNNAGISMFLSSNNNVYINNIYNTKHGISIYASSNNNVYNSTIYNITYKGISIGYSSNNNIYNNMIYNSNSGIGMYSSHDNNIYNNTIYNNDYGIYMYVFRNNNNNVYINNIYNNNDYGIYMYSSSDNNISCNRIQNNSAGGFYLAGGSTGNNIVYNNIIMNGVYNPSTGGYEYQFYNNQSYDVEAKHNFWGYGMTDDEINASIYDWQDNHEYGNVTFLPKLDEPGPCPPVPELPTVVLTILGLVSLTGYVELRKRNKE